MTEFERASMRYQGLLDAYRKAESVLATARAALTIAERERSAAFTKEVEAARTRVAVGGSRNG